MRVINLYFLVFFTFILFFYTKAECQNLDSMKNESQKASAEIHEILKSRLIKQLGNPTYDTSEIEIQILVYIHPLHRDSLLFSDVRQFGKFKSPIIDSLRQFCMNNDSLFHCILTRNYYNIVRYEGNKRHYKYNNIIEVTFLNKVAMRNRGMKCED